MNKISQLQHPWFFQFCLIRYKMAVPFSVVLSINVGIVVSDNTLDREASGQAWSTFLRQSPRLRVTQKSKALIPEYAYCTVGAVCSEVTKSNMKNCVYCLCSNTEWLRSNFFWDSASDSSGSVHRSVIFDIEPFKIKNSPFFNYICMNKLFSLQHSHITGLKVTTPQCTTLFIIGNKQNNLIIMQD